MKKIQKGNYGICKESADQFLYVSRWCMENGRYLTDTFYPFAVNVAFACELYLKAIMTYRSPNDEFIAGHDLFELYTGLSPNDATAIESLFSNKYKKTDIKTFLQQNRETFPDWRYAMEKGVIIDINGFEAFSQALIEQIKTMEDKYEEVDKE